MFDLCVWVVQWMGGMRVRAAEAVWRDEMGISGVVGVYSGREIVVVKKVELRVTKSVAVV